MRYTEYHNGVAVIKDKNSVSIMTTISATVRESCSMRMIPVIATERTGGSR